MRSATHARSDNSFARSAGTQTAKGAALIALAVVIGVVLLHTAPKVQTVTVATPATQPPARASKATVPPAPTSTTIPPARPTSQVHVEVANGTQVIGLGGKIRSLLSTDGYNTDKPALDAPTKDHATTTIYFQPGFQSDALQLATTLSIPATAVQPMATPAPVPQSLDGVDLLVIAGTDIAGSGGSSSGPAATVAPGSTSSGTAGHTTTTAVHHTSTTAGSHTTTTAAHSSSTTAKP
jgi:hypothetical protein